MWSLGAMKYLEGKKAYETLPHRAVLERTFVARAVAAGWPELEAKRVARMCRIMGASTQVGKQILSIRPAPSD